MLGHENDLISHAAVATTCCCCCFFLGEGGWKEKGKESVVTQSGHTDIKKYHKEIDFQKVMNKCYE